MLQRDGNHCEECFRFLYAPQIEKIRTLTDSNGQVYRFCSDACFKAFCEREGLTLGG